MVVRHASAGRKREWQGRDAERPLDDPGLRQAMTLADRLSSLPIRRLFASPTRRCVQTLEPLGERLGLQIEWLDRLAPAAPPGLLVDAITDRDFDGAVLCTHGELMRPLLATLRQQALTIESARPDEDRWLLGKGSAWVLSGKGSHRVSHLRHLEPLTNPIS